MAAVNTRAPKLGLPAKGFLAKNNVKIACTFDQETFEEVRLLAIKRKTSFAEQVRVLVEWGLEVNATGDD